MRSRTIFRYGIFAALALMLCWMLEYFAGFHTKTLGYEIDTEAVSSVFFFVIIFLGIKKLHSNQSTYGKSLRIGLMISICAAILFTLFMIYYLKSINPGFGDYQIAHERDRLVQEGVPDDILIQKINAMRLEYGNGAIVLWAFFRTFLEGIASSLLAPVFFKSRRITGTRSSQRPV